MKRQQSQHSGREYEVVAKNCAVGAMARSVGSEVQSCAGTESEQVQLVRLEFAARSPDAGCWEEVARLHYRRGAIVEASRAYAIASAMAPDDVELANMAAEAARRAHDFSGCVRSAERVLRVAPTNWIAHLNLAIALSYLGQDMSAEAAFKLASEFSSRHPIVDWEWHHAYMFQGQYASAYRCYERRFECSQFNNVARHILPIPIWSGKDISARHLLVVTEQGLGDVIMFARALPDLIAVCSRLTVAVPQTLVALFAASFPAADVVPVSDEIYDAELAGPWLQSLGSPDFYVPIGGLFHRGLGNTTLPPGHCPAYLKPSAHALKKWRDRIDRLMPLDSGRRIGICWASNPAREYADAARRAVHKSMKAEQMLDLAQPGAQLIGVLNAPHGLDQAGVVDVSADIATLDDTAALISQLDHVVSVDTSVAHLAGALGTGLSLLLPEVADARWGRPGLPLLWYPDMHVERATPCGWASAIQNVVAYIGSPSRRCARA